MCARGFWSPSCCPSCRPSMRPPCTCASNWTPGRSHSPLHSLRQPYSPAHLYVQGVRVLCVCVCISVCACVCVHCVCVYISVCACVCAYCVHVCAYCVHVCAYCVHVCACVCILCVSTAAHRDLYMCMALSLWILLLVCCGCLVGVRPWRLQPHTWLARTAVAGVVISSGLSGYVCACVCVCVCVCTPCVCILVCVCVYSVCVHTVCVCVCVCVLRVSIYCVCVCILCVCVYYLCVRVCMHTVCRFGSVRFPLEHMRSMTTQVSGEALIESQIQLRDLMFTR